ncbi:hypothetical protein TWF481_009152 [Arthrobotrys musiformis]|uniref:carboxypeptidase C n=1 Tax=Arthrobotrys musiformis TaxID=47236 RepID=A0AAV9W2Z0_9PEZI
MKASAVIASLIASPALCYLRIPHRGQTAASFRRNDFPSIQPSAGYPLQKPLVFDYTAAQPDRKPLNSDPFPIDDPSGIRIHPADERLCKSGSRQLTGHVNVTQHKSLFFWFHESRRDPKNDPLIIWLNGGPGASSLMGGFTELGPCMIDDEGKDTVYNKHGWSNFANIIFVDQPAGVGFSTVTNSSYLPYTAQVAATDFSVFIRRLFKHVIPEFASHKVHFMGESFGGVYFPSILSKILDQQQSLRELGLPDPFPKVESVVLADALVDWATNMIGAYRTSCVQRPDETGVKGQILNATACEDLSAAIPDCEKLGSECRLSMDGPTCQAAATVCDEMGESFWDLARAGERDPYDMRGDCPDKQLCLGFFEERMIKYFNQPHVLSLLGLPNTTVYEGINDEVNRRWTEWAYDSVLPVLNKMTQILEESDVRVLVYNGNSDWIINTAGALGWMDIVRWKGNGEFRAADLQPWEYTDDDGKRRRGGTTKQAKNGKLTFASIDKAGHMAPYDQPVALETLVQSWVEKTFGPSK